MPRTLGTITGTGPVVVVVEDDDGRVHFTAAATVDADGANGQNGRPVAYRVDDTGTEALANGGMRNVHGKVVCVHDWARGVVLLGADDEPEVFGDGWIASTTWYRHRTFAVGDPAGYLDAETVPYIVVPPLVVKQTSGAVRGCRARVSYGTFSVDAVVGDLGPANRIGELSIAAARALQIPTSPRDGGTHDPAVRYELWPGIAAPGFQLQPA